MGNVVPISKEITNRWRELELELAADQKRLRQYAVVVMDLRDKNGDLRERLRWVGAEGFVLGMIVAALLVWLTGYGG